jgi:hypothetical protein
MPAISLVVCIHRERELLERLLSQSADCYDELIVVHDGLDEANVSGIVERWNGRFIENVRLGSLEAQSPFAWGKARHDWILRLDADEFPSEELRAWLRDFRQAPDPDEDVSGYTCIWPLWSGTKTSTTRWPTGRIFLFHRQRIRFFGLVEQVPIPDTRYQPLDLILHHQPARKSYGVRNVLFRRQAYRWRRVIAQSLMQKPTDLPCWRWTSDDWPPHWRNLRDEPLRYSIRSLVRFPIRQFKGMVAVGQTPIISECLNPALHHFMLGLRVFAEKQVRR